MSPVSGGSPASYGSRKAGKYLKPAQNITGWLFIMVDKIKVRETGPLTTRPSLAAQY